MNLGDLGRDLIRSLSLRRQEVADRLLEAVQEHVASGEGQPPYSTRPGYYSTRTYRTAGARSRFARYARGVGKSPRAAVLWMDQGYAQWKSLVSGRPFKTQPVDFNLTGKLVNSLRGRARVNEGTKTLTAWVGFRRQRRDDTRLTNRELVAVHARRGSVNPFAPSVEDVQSIVRSTLAR